MAVSYTHLDVYKRQTYNRIKLKYGLPTSIIRDSPQPQYNYDEYKDEVKKRLQSAHQLAKEILKKKKESSKSQYDKNTADKQFRVGDKVLLHDETVRRGRSKKLGPQWIGPYLSLIHISVNYLQQQKRLDER